MTTATATEPAADHRALLAAATALAREVPLAALTPARVCQQAGLAIDRFERIWPEPLAFQRELLAELLDEVRDSVAKITSGMPAGRARLKLAVEAYLEANLARPTLRELALALQSDAAGAVIPRSRVAGFMLMMEMELQALAWPQPAATARLFTAAILEIAHAEHEAGRALAELRATVFSYFDSRSS